MDTYHFVLVKIYEAAQGKDSKPVDFRDILKSTGYFASYADILDRLSREGWITEDRKPHHVRITHWGIMEARKFIGGETATTSEINKNINKAISEAKELVNMLENLKQSNEDASNIQKKLSELSSTIQKIVNFAK
jgi:DNA-binding PadR family transcriptional regulator